MGVTTSAAVLPGALAAIKRRGGRLLVVGDPGGQRTLCRRLFGDRSADRTEILVQPSGQEHDCQCSSSTPHSGSTEEDRRTVVAPSIADAPISPIRLSALAADLVTTVERRAEAGLDPAELRVCLGVLDPLLATTSLERVSLYLETVLDRAEQERAMSHAHLRVPVDSDVVRRLESLFDAVIEVATEPTPRQRWHLTDRDITSDWLPLSD